MRIQFTILAILFILSPLTGQIAPQKDDVSPTTEQIDLSDLENENTALVKTSKRLKKAGNNLMTAGLSSILSGALYLFLSQKSPTSGLTPY